MFYFHPYEVSLNITRYMGWINNEQNRYWSIILLKDTVFFSLNLAYGY